MLGNYGLTTVCHGKFCTRNFLFINFNIKTRCSKVETVDLRAPITKSIGNHHMSLRRTVQLWAYLKSRHSQESMGMEGERPYKDDTSTLIEWSLSGPSTLIEWSILKTILRYQHYPSNSLQTIWQIIRHHHADIFPNLMLLASIASVFPVHTEDVKRGFSVQNALKTHWRKRSSGGKVLKSGNVPIASFYHCYMYWKEQIQAKYGCNHIDSRFERLEAHRRISRSIFTQYCLRAT